MVQKVSVPNAALFIRITICFLEGVLPFLYLGDRDRMQRSEVLKMWGQSHMLWKVSKRSVLFWFVNRWENDILALNCIQSESHSADTLAVSLYSNISAYCAGSVPRASGASFLPVRAASMANVHETRLCGRRYRTFTTNSRSQCHRAVNMQ